MSRAKLSPHQGVVPAIVWASRSAASKVTDCESSVKPLSSGHGPTVAGTRPQPFPFRHAMPGGYSSFCRVLASIVLEPRRKEKCFLRTLPFKSDWLHDLA